MTDKPIKILYVLGSGRSGTTIFGALLGMHTSMTHVGEILRIGFSENPLVSNICSCGAMLENCDYWSAIYEDWLGKIKHAKYKQYRQLQSKYEQLRSFPHLLIEIRNPSRDFLDYSKYTVELFKSISKMSGSNIIIDTSKYPGRALALANIPDLDVNIIHLIRDGRGFLWSFKKSSLLRENLKFRKMRSWILTWSKTIEWILINRVSEKVRSLTEKSSMSVRYEDFVNATCDTLTRIGERFGLQLVEITKSLESGEEISFGHIFGGNWVRMKGPTSLRLDQDWQTMLTGFDFFIYRLIAGQFAKRYNYRTGFE